MYGEAMMSLYGGQAEYLPLPAVRHLLMPRWLTHLGALGLFSVAVFDSSVVPVTLPGSGKGMTEESITATENSPSAPRCVSQCGIREGFTRSACD